MNVDLTSTDVRPFDHRLRHLLFLWKSIGGTADALSYARLPLSFVFILCAIYAPWMIPILGYLDGLADLADGPFARRYGSSDKGWFIDAFCDKVASGANLVALAYLVELELDFTILGVSTFWSIAIFFMIANFWNDYGRVQMVRALGWAEAKKRSSASLAGKIKVWFVSFGNVVMGVSYALRQTDTDPWLASIGSIIGVALICATMPPFRFRWAAWLGVIGLYAGVFANPTVVGFDLGLALGQFGLIGYFAFTCWSIIGHMRRRQGAPAPAKQRAPAATPALE